MALGYFCALYVCYAVQVHQTKYLVGIGFPAPIAAWALGLVSLVVIPVKSPSATFPTARAGLGVGPRLLGLCHLLGDAHRPGGKPVAVAALCDDHRPGRSWLRHHLGARRRHRRRSSPANATPASSPR
jgi:hypothetical protein